MPRYTHEDANKRKKWSMAAFGGWAVDGDGANTNGGGIVGDVTLAPAGGVPVGKTFDASEGGGTWGNTDVSGARADYAANDQLFPDVAVASGDAVAFGASIPFCELAINMSATVAVYDADGVLAWEYSDGAGSWASLTLALDNTESGGGTGDRAFGQDGVITFVPPSDWASVALDGVTAYWVRAAVQAGKFLNMTTVPLVASAADRPVPVSPRDGFTCPHGGTITDIRAIDGASTLHTAADVKFILMNFTTGGHTGELTWAQDQRQDAWGSLTLAVNQGDELGVLVTQEDGTNEPSGVMLELQVSG